MLKRTLVSYCPQEKVEYYEYVEESSIKKNPITPFEWIMITFLISFSITFFYLLMMSAYQRDLNRIKYYDDKAEALIINAGCRNIVDSLDKNSCYLDILNTKIKSGDLYHGFVRKMKEDKII